MNRILFSAEEIHNHRVKVRDERAKHVCDHLRLQVGDRLRVGEINGLCGEGLITTLTPADSGENAHIELELDLREAPPPPSPLQMILALPRPKAFGRLLESIVELGVKKLVVLQAAKVEKSYWGAHQLRPDSMDRHIRMGLQQSGDTIWPEIIFAERFRPFVEDRLAIWSGPCTERWVLHPYGDPTAFSSVADRPTSVAIGPEGGWTDFEIELFASQGFRVGSLGPRILSTETVVPAIAGRFLQKRAL